MLHIFFGDMPEAIFNTDVYFRNVYEDSWLLTPFAKKVIKAVDRSEVLDTNAIKSPVLGIIPPTTLSNGVKTLILIDNISDQIFNASTCGDNCARFILEMGRRKDITINLRHLMDFGKRPFKATILNSGTVVTNMLELTVSSIGYI